MTNKKAQGVRAKTRDKFKRKKRATVNLLLQTIPEGTPVQIDVNSSIHSGIPFRRYQGISGVVTGKRGRAFIVATKEGNAPRTLIVGPAHLKVLHNQSAAVSGE